MPHPPCALPVLSLLPQPGWHKRLQKLPPEPFQSYNCCSFSKEKFLSRAMRTDPTSHPLLHPTKVSQPHCCQSLADLKSTSPFPISHRIPGPMHDQEEKGRLPCSSQNYLGSFICKPSSRNVTISSPSSSQEAVKKHHTSTLNPGTQKLHGWSSAGRIPTLAGSLLLPAPRTWTRMSLHLSGTASGNSSPKHSMTLLSGKRPWLL